MTLRSVVLVGLLSTTCAQRHRQRARFLAVREGEPVVLAQTSVHRVESASGAHSKGRSQREPLEASWFDSFSQGESNYDMEADKSVQRSNGWEYKADDPYKEGNVLKAVFYHESPSGSSREAWQTHYPALTGGPAGHPKSTGTWHVTQGGAWTQDYKPPESQRGPNHAEWFDGSIGQYDGFGRVKSPISGSPRLYEDGYQERSVNTTITCRNAGCSAYSLMQAFNGNTETARDCRLSLYLHPTDFDDQYSGERLTFIKVNGVTVNTDCFPMVSGCNATSQNPMFSCLRDMPLDKIIDSSGFLNISAQISDVVDECPYQGNLLSGVPLVTCLIAKKPALAAATPPPVSPSLPVVHTPPAEANYFNLKVPLRCPFRGCAADANIAVGPDTARRISRCTLNMKIYQTDFDNQEDTNEAIEYVQINGVRVVSNMIPGKNPCRSQWAGSGLSLVEMEHMALQDFDVTSNASSGLVALEVKISESVDECAHDGYLLDGVAEMNCTLAPSSSAEAAATAATFTNASSLASNASGSSPLALVQRSEPAVPARGASRQPSAQPFGLRAALLEKLRR